MGIGDVVVCLFRRVPRGTDYRGKGGEVFLVFVPGRGEEEERSGVVREGTPGSVSFW